MRIMSPPVNPAPPPCPPRCLACTRSMARVARHRTRGQLDVGQDPEMLVEAHNFREHESPQARWTAFRFGDVLADERAHINGATTARTAAPNRRSGRRCIQR